jgi:hypothetical protein
MERCPICRDIGWVLDTKTSVEPLGLELLPCLLPDCQWSGRAIATLSVDGRFRDVVRHPKDGRVMSLTGSSVPRHRDPLPHRLQARRAVRSLTHPGRVQHGDPGADLIPDLLCEIWMGQERSLKVGHHDRGRQHNGSVRSTLTK